jgi:hypothetical protein
MADTNEIMRQILENQALILQEIGRLTGAILKLHESNNDGSQPKAEPTQSIQ